MKKAVLLRVFFGLCAVYVCVCTDGKSTDVNCDSITVGFRVFAHNLPRNASDVSIEIEKETSDGTIKGNFDLSRPADKFGDYESSLYVTYNLHHENDKVHVRYDYTLSDFNGAAMRKGTKTLSYTELKLYDGDVYEVDLEYTDSDVRRLWEGWQNNQSAMTLCFDLPYYYLNGTFLPSDSSEAKRKEMLYESLQAHGYVETGRGGMNSSLFFSDGDIVMLGFNSVPVPQNAPHYAVAENGKLWQISHWSGGGDFDGPREPSFFIYRPEILNPYTGATYSPVNGYLYYRVFSKRKTLPDG